MLHEPNHPLFFSSLPPSEEVKYASWAVMHSKGWSYRQIANEFRCNPSTVRDHVFPVEAYLSQKMRPYLDEDYYDDDDYTGGLVEHFVLFALLEDPTRTVRDISYWMLRINLPFSVGKTSVSKVIHALNIRIGDSIKKPQLTDKQIFRRLQFVVEIRQDSRYHLPWFFSDECMIDLNPYRRTVYRVPGIRTAEKIYQEYKKHPIHVMIWGGIAANYKSPLLRVDGYITAERYIQMLTESGIIESLDSQYGQGRWVFQDDGAPPHRAKITKQFLKSRCHNLATEDIYWPANSPDLNPQEKMWAILRQRTEVKGCNSPEELFDRLKTTWENISMETVNLLVQRFSVSLSVIEALTGGCINGHRNLVKQLGTGAQTVKQIKWSLEDEKTRIKGFVDSSQQFFNTFTQLGENRADNTTYTSESFQIVKMLPPETLKVTKVLKTYSYSSLKMGKVKIQKVFTFSEVSN
jgi:inhibitor of nuclear factor kappa-B kinase subunit alpha